MSVRTYVRTQSRHALPHAFVMYANEIMALENRLAKCFFRSFSIERFILEVPMKGKYAEEYWSLKKSGHQSDEMSFGCLETKHSLQIGS